MRAGRLGGMGLAAFLLLASASRGQDSLNVTKVGEIRHWDGALDVASVGNYALLSTGASGLQILDVSNPFAPVQISYVETPGSANRMFYSENVAYVADGLGGLAIIDISDPGHPFIIGQCPTYSAAWDVAVNGDYAYVAKGNHGLGVVDISQPTSPQEIYYIDTPGWAFALAIQGNYLYLTDGSYGIRIYSILDPDLPVEIANCGTTGECLDIAVLDDYALTADGAALTIIDISNSINPVIEVSLSLPGPSEVLAIDSNLVFLSGQDMSALCIVDISQISNPILLATLPLPETGNGIAIADTLVYMACGNSGFSLVNVASPTAPFQIASLDSVSSINAVVVHENLAYAGGNPGGMHIYDISDPTSPVEIGALSINADICALELSENTLYAASPDSGLSILDVSDPTNPQEIGSWYSWWMSDIEVIRDTAFVTSGTAGSISVLDVSNPANPIQIATIAGLAEHVVAFEIDQNYLYVVSWHDNQWWEPSIHLDIFDIQNLQMPLWLGRTYPYLHYMPAVDVFLANGYVYVLGLDGISAVDVADPENPVQVAFLLIENLCNEGAAAGDHICVASTNVLHVFDIANPSTINLSGFYNNSSPALGIAAQDSLIYVAQDYVFAIYDISAALPVNPWEATPSQPSSFVLHPPHPNPFNSSTVASFELRAPSHVSLRVYDTAGRLVRTLVDGWRLEGKHQAVFDGSGLPSGIYLARLTVEDPLGAGDFQQTQKLILLK